MDSNAIAGFARRVAHAAFDRRDDPSVTRESFRDNVVDTLHEQGIKAQYVIDHAVVEFDKRYRELLERSEKSS